MVYPNQEQRVHRMVYDDQGQGASKSSPTQQPKGLWKHQPTEKSLHGLCNPDCPLKSPLELAQVNSTFSTCLLPERRSPKESNSGSRFHSRTCIKYADTNPVDWQLFCRKAGMKEWRSRLSQKTPLLQWQVERGVPLP